MGLNVAYAAPRNETTVFGPGASIDLPRRQRDGRALVAVAWGLSRLWADQTLDPKTQGGIPFPTGNLGWARVSVAMAPGTTRMALIRWRPAVVGGTKCQPNRVAAISDTGRINDKANLVPR